MRARALSAEASRWLLRLRGAQGSLPAQEVHDQGGASALGELLRARHARLVGRPGAPASWRYVLREDPSAQKDEGTSRSRRRVEALRASAEREAARLRDE